MIDLAAVPELGLPLVATADAYFLAEGPLWDAARERLLWVDIMAGCVYSGALTAAGTIDVVERFEFPDTAGTVAVDATGELVVAGTQGLFYRSTDGVITPAPEVIGGEGRRFNDGKPDPAGRLVVGTKGPTGSQVETFIRFESDGSVTVLDDDLLLANGLGWTSDGRRMYSVDTGGRAIHVRDYDPDTGEVGERRVFATVDDGYPDGMTLDADNHVWVALWGGGRVLRFSPDGDAVGRIDVPAPHTSSVTFAGPDLDTLVITTARENLSDDQLAAYPMSGRLFTVKTGFTGGHAPLWAGRP